MRAAEKIMSELENHDNNGAKRLINEACFFLLPVYIS
jgi:hypothetical protein